MARRIRGDYVSGTVDVTLGAADTTLSSAGLADLPAVASPDVAALVLFNGSDYEIVHVTAHTAAATSATIARAQEGSTASTWTAGATWHNGPTELDLTARGINAQTGTAYTLTIDDAGQFVTMTNAAASTLTVPPNSSVAFPVGTVVEGAQLGAGQVTITPGSGVTVNGTPGLKVAEQYGSFALLKTGTDAWLAMGRLAA